MPVWALASHCPPCVGFALQNPACHYHGSSGSPLCSRALPGWCRGCSGAITFSVASAVPGLVLANRPFCVPSNTPRG